jgi:hypothetical protein
MKYIKKFETTTEEYIQLLDDTLRENPQYDTHDFFIFLARDEFKEAEGGMYKKTIDIENMVKITADGNSLAAMNGLERRAMVQHDVKMYHIWLPKEISDDVTGKGSNSIEPWLVDLIDKHKSRGGDEQGKRVFREVRQRRNDIDKYNL